MKSWVPAKVISRETIFFLKEPLRMPLMHLRGKQSSIPCVAEEWNDLADTLQLTYLSDTDATIL